MSGAIENSRYKSYVKSYVSSCFTSYLVHNRSSTESIVHRTYVVLQRCQNAIILYHASFR